MEVQPEPVQQQSHQDQRADAGQHRHDPLLELTDAEQVLHEGAEDRVERAAAGCRW